MDRNLVARVTGAGALALVPISAVAFSWADLPGLLGVLAGGGVALGNFRWLSTASHRFLALFRSGRVEPWGLVGFGLRHLCLFSVLGVLLWSGHVHPVWLMVGLSVLPPVLIVEALRRAALNP